MRHSEKITNYIKLNPVQAITVIIAVIGLFGTLANISIVSKLAPIVKDIAVITQEVQANTQKDNTEHPTFVTKDMFTLHEDSMKVEFVDVNQKLDWIEARLGK